MNIENKKSVKPVNYNDAINFMEERLEKIFKRIFIMIIAVVTFNIDKELTSSLLKEKFLETSPIYKDTPGLIRKNYICDTSKNLAGGVYCFDNIENAKSWFDEDRVKWITDRYSPPKIKFYENPVTVDNNIDEIIS